MFFAFEFDDRRLTEILYAPGQEIVESYPLGQSIADFLSRVETTSKSECAFLHLVENATDEVGVDDYSDFREFVDLCIEDPLLRTIDNFMFFVEWTGLAIPEHHLQYNIEPKPPVENLVGFENEMSSLERKLKQFAKSDKSEHSILCVYTCQCIADVCVACLYHLIKLGLVIKKCDNCGKYFVPLRRSDAIYCDRNSPFNPSKTCKEDGSQRTYEEKLKADSTEKLYRSIYQTKKMRIRRNPDIVRYKEDFEKWNVEALKRRKEIKKGLKSSEEFVMWLQESKK